MPLQSLARVQATSHTATWPGSTLKLVQAAPLARSEQLDSEVRQGRVQISPMHSRPPPQLPAQCARKWDSLPV
jgi:hypothetical protein